MSRATFDAVAELATAGGTTRLEQLLETRDRDTVRRDVARTAGFHLVDGLVGAALAAHPGVDDALAAYFHERQHQAVLHHLSTLADLAFVRGVLDDAGVAWAVLKGPFLVEHAYRTYDVRSYADLDVLVDRRRFGEVLDALTAAGARPSDRNWPLIASTRRGELSLGLPHGTLLDLHWHLVVEAKVRRGFAIDVDDILERRRVVGAESSLMSALAADDAWFHTAMHAMLTGGDRLLWAVDLERLLAVDGEPDAAAWARAARFGWAAAGAMGTDLVALAFPERVAPARSAPRSLWRVGRRAFLHRTGLNRSIDRPHTFRTFTTSVRRNALVSTEAWAALLWDQGVRGVLDNPDHPWRRRSGATAASGSVPARPSPLKVDVPSAADRRAFLEEISRASAGRGR